MCLGIPGRIVEILPDQPDLASVDVQGVPRRISLALLTDDLPAPGDWVLIHLGFALQRMTADEAADATAVLADLGGGPAAEGVDAEAEGEPPWAGERWIA